MDWKDILAQKVDEGSLEREEFTAPDVSDVVSPAKEILHVILDKKGRKGKTATIIEGFACDDDKLLETAAILKTRLGTGGSARGGEILIQGDSVARVKELLKELGYKVK